MTLKSLSAQKARVFNAETTLKYQAYTTSQELHGCNVKPRLHSGIMLVCNRLGVEDLSSVKATPNPPKRSAHAWATT